MMQKDLPGKKRKIIALDEKQVPLGGGGGDEGPMIDK
jgi:hypothetical protein